MSDRRFGVEIECGIKEVEHWEQYLKARELLEANGFGQWAPNVDVDGSGVEIRTPILQGKEGIATVHQVMNLLRDNGGYVSEEDGLHIHHDAPEFVENNELIIRLVKSWYANQDLIDHFCAEYRADWDYCPKTWDAFSIADLEDKLNTEGLREWWDERGALNIESLAIHGSIELRQHEGTLDPEKAEAWIRFGQAFVDDVVARSRAMATSASPEALLRRLRIPAAHQRRLLASWEEVA